MLRDAGVADADQLGELADGSLAFDELAKDQQPMTAGEGLQELAGTIRRTLHEVSLDFHTCTYMQVRIYVKQNRREAVEAS